MKESKDKINVVFSTGAGISKESGIETFRGEDGTWNGVNVDQVATLNGFMEDPERAYAFYQNAFGDLLSGKIKPNQAHLAIAELEKDPRFNVIVITQNIDNLHEQAGSSNVIHMHGDINHARCIKTKKLHSIYEIRDKCSCCDKPSILRPNVVFFGEAINGLEKVYDAVEEANILVSIGTSGNVYPAAGLPEHLKLTGRFNVEVIEFNLEETGTFGIDKTVLGKASETVPQYIRDLVSNN